MTITISPDGSGGATVDCPCVTVFQGQSVKFVTSSSAPFAAIFDRTHPFRQGHRVFVNGNSAAEAKKIGEFSYTACYLEGNKEGCTDPKVIVTPVSRAILDLSTVLIEDVRVSEVRPLAVTVKNAGGPTIAITGFESDTLVVDKGASECHEGTELAPGDSCTVAFTLLRPAKTASAAVTYRDTVSKTESKQVIVLTLGR